MSRVHTHTMIRGLVAMLFLLVCGRDIHDQHGCFSKSLSGGLSCAREETGKERKMVSPKHELLVFGFLFSL